MRIFKAVKSPEPSGAPPPKPRFVAFAYYWDFCRVRYYTIERALLLRKITEVTTVDVLVKFFLRFSAYFHFNLGSFCWCGRKNIFCFRALVPYSYATGKIIGVG